MRSMTNGESKYIELHASSAFSFLAGSSEPEAFIERAVKSECLRWPLPIEMAYTACSFSYLRKA